MGTILFQVLSLAVLSLSTLALVLVDDKTSPDSRVNAGKVFGWSGMLLFLASFTIVLCDIFPPAQTFAFVKQS
jgi:hypothetical protein